MISFPTARTFIDEVTPEDLAALAGIHERSFPRPWTAEEIAALFAGGTTVDGLVLWRQPVVGARRPSGFLIMRTAADESEILTVAVDPGCRGRGYGRLLMEEAQRRLYRERIASLYLEVEETNHIALGLYLSMGFQQVGERPGYYAGEGAEPTTALVMKLQLR